MSGDDLPNIIAVDDDYAVRMAMEFMFKKWPEYNLILAEDSKDALTKLEEREYMMMFCDINMPVMSGLDLLKVVKDKYPDLPVVMLTSETDIQNSITAFRYGAMDYLLKPPTVATIKGAIDKTVEFLEEQASKDAIDMGDFKQMVENFSPEEMGLTKSGSKNTEFTKLVNMGATMRLGDHEIKVLDGKAKELYGKDIIFERHRHRYEINPNYIEQIEGKGMKYTGRDSSGRRMEILELEGHPYFVASQFHPEFKSRPDSPSPLHLGLVKAALDNKKA